MAGLRLGTNLMRQKQSYRDWINNRTKDGTIATDEDSIPMETLPKGESDSIYKFKRKQYKQPSGVSKTLVGAEGLESAYHVIAGVGMIAGVIARVRAGVLPLEA